MEYQLGKNVVGLTVISLLLTGCTSIIQQQTYRQYEQKISSGSLKEATKLAIKKADLNPEHGHARDVLWSLEAGALLRMQKEYVQSTAFFDDAEALMKLEDTENVADKSVDLVSSLLVNDSVMDYEHTYYDGIMANTYKAINFMFARNLADARVEWNRVDDRQRRASEAFAKKIAKLKAEQAKEWEKAHQDGLNNIEERSLSEAEKLIKARGVNFSEWESYGDYLNPLSTYMHGLFFMITAQGNSDINKAYDSFRRATGMTGSAVVEADLTLADRLRRGKQSLKAVQPTVWVIFENGLGPRKEEIRIDLPIYLASDNVLYTGMALPKLVERQQAYPELTVEGTKTTLLSEMDRVIQAEFKAEFPYILSREVARTVLKTVGQKQLNDNNAMAGLVASAAQIATTSADLRVWSSLPKEFQLARINKPNDNQLSITATGMVEPLSVALTPEAQFSIVYIRAVSPSVSPTIDVMSI